MFAYIKDWVFIASSPSDTEEIECDEIHEFEWIENPFFDWETIIERPMSGIEIWDKILSQVFEWNPYAQLADLTKSQVTTLALLVPILGKDTIRVAYADLIETLEKVSEARAESWLTPFDLSFLD
jgi:hypothetical protein